jgi:ubiquinone/menaquinone biosynthesis C-methylase UbiE
VSPGTRTGVREYRPFPDHDTRNARQQRLEVPVMLRALGVPHDARILEVGCGRGVALPAIQEHRTPARLVGLDIDPWLLSQAGDTHAELVCGDVRAMPFPDASFDVCVDFGTCYHIARPLDALREIARPAPRRALLSRDAALATDFAPRPLGLPAAPVERRA